MELSGSPVLLKPSGSTVMVFYVNQSGLGSDSIFSGLRFNSDLIVMPLIQVADSDSQFHPLRSLSRRSCLVQSPIFSKNYKVQRRPTQTLSLRAFLKKAIQPIVNISEDDGKKKSDATYLKKIWITSSRLRHSTNSPRTFARCQRQDTLSIWKLFEGKIRYRSKNCVLSLCLKNMHSLTLLHHLRSRMTKRMMIHLLLMLIILR